MQIDEAIDRSLFLLGAGASYDAQCKLSAGMLDDIKERIGRKDDDTFNKPEKEALKFLLSCLEYHGEWRTLESAGNFKFIPNIEELALLIRRIKNREQFLPYPITGNWADKLIILESEYRALQASDKSKENLFESLEHKLKSSLLEEWLEPKSYNFLLPLKEFLEFYPNKEFRMDFFSFNYDMVFENFFADIHLRPWRGFVSGEWRGMNIDDIPKDFGRINLYKVHGSLDWVRLISGDFKENKEELPQEDKDNIQLEHDPYVIFGQGTKTFSVEPFFSIVQHLRRKLAERNYFFCIGYSFFDPYINNLLIEAVRGTTKKIIIVNPGFGPEEIRTKGKLNGDNTEFKRIKYPEGKSELELASYIEEIQKNSFYSELPEFNIKQMNAKALEFLPIGTADFIKSYFSNGGQILIDLISEFENERREAEEPFLDD